MTPHASFLPRGPIVVALVALFTVAGALAPLVAPPYADYADLGTGLARTSTARAQAQVVVQPAPTPVVVAPAPAPAPSPSRLRLGLEGGAGGEWGTPRGASLGLFGQLGVQVSSTFALFYQPSLYAHALGTNDDADVFAAWGHLGMADLTFGALQLGVGGGVDVGRFVSCENSGDNCDRGPRQVNPAVGGRAALVLGLEGPRGRIGIPFALHVHSTFLDDDERLTALIFTIGIQRY